MSVIKLIYEGLTLCPSPKISARIPHISSRETREHRQRPYFSHALLDRCYSHTLYWHTLPHTPSIPFSPAGPVLSSKLLWRESSVNLSPSPGYPFIPFLISINLSTLTRPSHYPLASYPTSAAAPRCILTQSCPTSSNKAPTSGSHLDSSSGSRRFIWNYCGADQSRADLLTLIIQVKGVRQRETIQTTALRSCEVEEQDSGDKVDEIAEGNTQQIRVDITSFNRNIPSDNIPLTASTSSRAVAYPSCTTNIALQTTSHNNTSSNMADQSHYPAADENVVLGPEATPIISRDTFLPSGPKSAASAVSSSKGASSAAGGEGAAMQGRGEHLHVPTIIAPQAAGEGFQDSGAATPLSLAESGRAGSFATAKDVDEVETPMAVEDGPEVAGGLTAGGEVGERGVLKDAERKSLLSVAGGGAEIERTRSSTSIQSDGPFLARTPTQNSAQHNPLTSVVSKQSSTYKTAISQHPAPAPTINLPANTSPQAQPLTKPRRPSIVFGFPANDEPGKEKAQITSSLKTWWKGFSGGGAGKPGQGPGQARGKGKEREKGLEVPKGVFGVLLEKSLQYASVQISTTKADGGLYVWG